MMQIVNMAWMRDEGKSFEDESERRSRKVTLKAREVNVK